MLKKTLTILAVAGAIQAQQVVAPTPSTVGSPRGDGWGNYNITQSFETGYRFHTVDGNVGEYRSDVNYGNGLRLLSSGLAINSKDGHGHYFDQILLNTGGLGNDPYQSAVLRVEKNKLYRYDMTWRLSDYFNPGLTVAGGNHLQDTTRRIQDHDLTLLPDSWIRFHIGYSRNTEDGPALSTAQEFNLAGSAYPVFTNVRRQWNEYRVGTEIQYAGFQFNLQHRWDYFKDDTPVSSAGVVAAGTPSDLTVVQQFHRSQPVHGSNPGWLGNLHTRRKHWSMNARLTYNGGRNDFALGEVASGLDATATPGVRQIVVGGNASRPDLAGDFNVAWLPSDRVSVVNNTSISNNRIDGTSQYSEFFTPNNLGTTVYFRDLGIRTVTNSLDLNYRTTEWIGFFAGWRYSDRQVRTVEGFTLPAFASSSDSAAYEVTNQLQAGQLGIRLRPLKPFTINLDGELGRTNQPLTPTSDKNFQTLGARADYRIRKLQMSASYRDSFDFYSSFAIFNSRTRSFNSNVSWAPRDWFTLDASYNKLHVNSSSFLAFFAGLSRSTLQAKYRSIYESNIHAVNLGMRFGVTKRADLYFGYSITKDVGDGRATAVPAGTTDPIQSLLSSVQTFPLSYQSPLARVSIRITPKLRWNVGYQFYNYAEKFQILSYYQNFHAHTGYTSVLWAF